MSKRLVDYSFSSDDGGNDELLPKKISKLDEGRPIMPNILPSTPWEVEDEWVVANQWPPQEETPFSSEAITITNITSLARGSELPLDQGYMVGGGKKNKVEFTDGECRRTFRGAVYYRSFVPTKKASDLTSTLESVVEILRPS